MKEKKFLLHSVKGTDPYDGENFVMELADDSFLKCMGEELDKDGNKTGPVKLYLGLAEETLSCDSEEDNSIPNWPPWTWYPQEKPGQQDEKNPDS